ncbi:MAG: hypothetical protein M1838_001067 [Thelocarpon superellum]|nr:MAG: hypothetical protein M1838_001067 [Thelocarpon superellum]
MAPAEAASRADVIQNKLNVLLAHQQRLLSTWLPPRKPEEAATAETQSEIEREEEAIFTPVPATLGIGATLPADAGKGSGDLRTRSSNDTLRKRLLGRRAVLSPATSRKPGSHRPVTAKTSVTSVTSTLAPRSYTELDDEDDVGRSAVGRSKRQKQDGAPSDPSPRSTSLDTTAPPLGSTAQDPSQRRRVSKSFLDDVLDQRLQRKKKNARRKSTKEMPKTAADATDR